MDLARCIVNGDLMLTEQIGQGRKEHQPQPQPEQREKNAGLCLNPSGC